MAVSFGLADIRIARQILSRKGVKERGVLPAEGARLEVHESLRWTNQQKATWQRYAPGQVVIFAPRHKRPTSSATVVRINIYLEASRAIEAEVAGQPLPQDLDFPNVDDGVEGMAFIAAAVQSAKAGAVWTKLPAT